MGVVPWSPISGGFLTGKYTRGEAGTEGAGHLAGANPFGDSKFTDRNWDILGVLRAVAEEAERTPAEIALAQTGRLDRASALAPDCSSMMGSPGLRGAVFGGAAVEGWQP